MVYAAQGSSQNDKVILDSCVGVFLFGVPNRGLNNENLLSLVKEKASAPIVVNLMESSELLQVLHVAFLRSYEIGLKSCFVVSFYETKDTKTVQVGNICQSPYCTECQGLYETSSMSFFSNESLRVG